jgi:hypothetical protein
MEMRVIIEESKEKLESTVTSLLQGSRLLHINCQRNVFYRRKEGTFQDELTETFTAFIVVERNIP